MFDIGWSELLLCAVVALVVIGPKELPGALRTLGQWTAKLRRMAAEFQGQFHEAMREAEMADLKKQVDEMTSQAQSYANFDPIGDVRREIESTQHQIESAVSGDPLSTPVSTPASVATDTPAVPELVSAPAEMPPAPPAESVAPGAGGKPT